VVYESETGDFTLALGGDFMLTQRIRVYQEPGYLTIVEAMRNADAAFVNLETTVRRWDEGTPTITSGTPMTTVPELLDELNWLGIDIVSCANNHAYDYGENGVLATLRHLDAAGIPHAGSGRNLAEARMPAYVETKRGRVALVLEQGIQSARRYRRPARHQSARLQDHLYGRWRDLRHVARDERRTGLRQGAGARPQAFLQRQGSGERNRTGDRSLRSACGEGQRFLDRDNSCCRRCCR